MSVPPCISHTKETRDKLQNHDYQAVENGTKFRGNHDSHLIFRVLFILFYSILKLQFRWLNNQTTQIPISLSPNDFSKISINNIYRSKCVYSR